MNIYYKDKSINLLDFYKLEGTIDLHPWRPFINEGMERRRYQGNGMTIRKHCVCMALLAPSPEEALSYYLHDAEEAFLSDIPAPVAELINHQSSGKFEELSERIRAHIGVHIAKTEHIIKPLNKPQLRELDTKLGYLEALLFNLDAPWVPSRYSFLNFNPVYEYALGYKQEYIQNYNYFDLDFFAKGQNKFKHFAEFLEFAPSTL